MCSNETHNAGGGNIFLTFENIKGITFSQIFEYDSPSENWKWKKCQQTLGLALEILDLDHETEWQLQMVIDKLETLCVRESRSQDS